MPVIVPVEKQKISLRIMRLQSMEKGLLMIQSFRTEMYSSSIQKKK